MRLAIEQVKSGNAQAAVSAGNTGALMATARFVLKTLPHVDRPAIAKFLPAQDGKVTLMLDLGANVDCTAEQLVQLRCWVASWWQRCIPTKNRRAWAC